MASAYLQSLKLRALALRRAKPARRAMPPSRTNRKRPDGGTSDGVPVDPSRPDSLDGGAAAALAFDD